ncbi:hypothetical protein ABFT23_21800 [Nocardioides sp. C4-1]|uniref:hypothetical protein n=1 Tax=Nocardioides sp. C4-1 TaxID=3151851 RepID=UPI003267458D
MVNDVGFSCTAEHLTLHRPVGSLSPAHRSMVCGWLAAHGLDPDVLAVDHPVRRDVRYRVLRWSEVQDGGSVDRVRHVGRTAVRGLWPRPFPVDLRGPSAFVDADGYTLTPR